MPKKKLPPRNKDGSFRKRKTARKNPRPKTKARKRKANPMARTAVVNKRKGRKRAPKRYGGAKRKRRRNPSTALSPYSSGTYYRRPNPSMFDMETYTRTLPAATAGIWFARWAVNMAGPFEPDSQGRLVPGFKHAIAIMVATEFGGKMVGQLLGGRREIDMAQIAAIGYGGDLFLRKRILVDSQWVQDNISLEGDEEYETDGYEADGMGADTYTDPAGNKYIRSGSGWQLADWQFGQPDEVPSDAEPGDIVQTPSGDIYEVMADGNMQSRPDLAGFEQTSPLGGFEQSSPLGYEPPAAPRGVATRADSNNSFGYAAA